MRFWAVIKQNTRSIGVEVCTTREEALKIAGAKASKQPGERFIVFESVEQVHVPPVAAVVEEIKP